MGRLPIINQDDVYTGWDKDQLMEVDNWLGEVEMGGEGADTAEGGMVVECGQMTTVSVSGFMSSKHLVSAMEEVAKYLDTRQDVPWCGMVGVGLPDKLGVGLPDRSVVGVDGSGKLTLCTSSHLTAFILSSGVTVAMSRNTMG